MQSISYDVDWVNQTLDASGFHDIESCSCLLYTSKWRLGGFFPERWSILYWYVTKALQSHYDAGHQPYAKLSTPPMLFIPESESRWGEDSAVHGVLDCGF